MILSNPEIPRNSVVFMSLREAIENILVNYIMGSSSSKEVVKYVESDESKRIRLLNKLEKQLEELKQEVITVEPAISSNVRYTVGQEQDALLMRYSQLTDIEQVARDIQRIFGGFPILNFLVETATKLVSTITSSQDLKEILRWQERKKVTRVGDKVYGMEVHYKLKLLEEDKGTMFTGRSKDTVVLIAYKCITHAMDLNPEEFPDNEEFKKLTF